MISTCWSSKWWSYWFFRNTNGMVSRCTLTLGLVPKGYSFRNDRDLFQTFTLGGTSNIFFMFPPIWGKMNPFWLICFKWVCSTTKLFICLVSPVQKSRFWSRNWTVRWSIVGRLLVMNHKNGFLGLPKRCLQMGWSNHHWNCKVGGSCFGLKVRGTTIVVDSLYYMYIWILYKHHKKHLHDNTILKLVTQLYM